MEIEYIAGTVVPHLPILFSPAMDDMDMGSTSGDSAPGDAPDEEPMVPHPDPPHPAAAAAAEEAMAMSPPPPPGLLDTLQATTAAAAAAAAAVQPSSWPNLNSGDHPSPSPLLGISRLQPSSSSSSSHPHHDHQQPQVLQTSSSSPPPSGHHLPPYGLSAAYVPSETYLREKVDCVTCFRTWGEQEQVHFVQELLSSMCQHQHGAVNAFLRPMLQRDFISLLPKRGLDHVAENILGYLDARSLCAAELVCHSWLRVISEGMLWKKLIEHKVGTDTLWRGLAERRGWVAYLFKPRPGQGHPGHSFYRRLYPVIIKDIDAIESNWRCGKHNLQRINCQSENSKGVYCLQYDDEKIVSGLRDNTIKMWDRANLSCVRELNGHTGSVLCLQYDEKVIISGSSDSTVRALTLKESLILRCKCVFPCYFQVRVWDVNTGEMVNTLIHHCEAVLHLRFFNGMMVTCSKDRSIAVWDMVSPNEINLRRVLVGHRAAVNVVDFDDKYIVSASGDRTIKVWNTSSCEFVRTLNGHKRGIACLQYHDRLVVSGSSDNTIRLWDIECGACLRVLEGHEELVRCIRFDSKRIVSGAYDGKIKVWDLKAALDPSATAGSLCIKTLVEHTGRVFRLQFDEFQIVSSSHDDTILIWDFLNCTPPDSALAPSPNSSAMSPGGSGAAGGAAHNDSSRSGDGAEGGEGGPDSAQNRGGEGGDGGGGGGGDGEGNPQQQQSGQDQPNIPAF